ncbi:hypothetical protein PRUPE_5G115500 [Prunus persica]|uniref:Uncharacterized protein n=1 Tax=Prunus persica TaxID=3760 RepID=A0A251P709_PRUPE|nr:hypothetical protein PRUPE_5G115500 [Prunus persica]
MMKKKEEKEEEEEAASAAKIWDCGSPLYDSYELASVGHILERHTMAFPFFCRDSGGEDRMTKIKTKGSDLWKRKESNGGQKRKKLRTGFHSFLGTLLFCRKRDVYRSEK